MGAVPMATGGGGGGGGGADSTLGIGLGVGLGVGIPLVMVGGAVVVSVLAFVVYKIHHAHFGVASESMVTV